MIFSIEAFAVDARVCIEWPSAERETTSSRINKRKEIFYKYKLTDEENQNRSCLRLLKQTSRKRDYLFLALIVAVVTIIYNFIVEKNFVSF